jgi:hypothetical protein
LIRAKLLDALLAKYKAIIKESLAIIEIYLTNSVGIGEHPQHLQEIDKLLQMITDAEEKISTIERHYGRPSIN